jgi:glycerophosphoryl diester phosphodiesterase
MWSRQVIATSAAALIAGVYVMNASWLAPQPAGSPRVLAHRGMYQHTRPQVTDHDTCSARRMKPPSHSYLENTIPSMQASFDAGATAVELDAHPLKNGEFAVFHDVDLDCRTNGRGATKDHSMAYLRSLDAGYGYSPDGGKTFPLRGKGVGMIKSLHEVLSALPGKTIVIDIQSTKAVHSERLIAYLRAHGHPVDSRLWVWAEGPARDRLRRLAPQARVISTRQAKACVVRYLAAGWAGYVPDACRGGSIFVPIDLRWAFWGWPNRFLARMREAGTEVVLTGPFAQREPGLLKVSHLNAVPARFPGIILTDRIDPIGPAVLRRWHKKPSQKRASSSRAARSA